MFSASLNIDHIFCPLCGEITLVDFLSVDHHIIQKSPVYDM